ncbi:SPOSA6832_03566, partial [Sporobolomyces salmonicolor]
MNHLTTPFRSALRAFPSRTYAPAVPAFRAYSTPAQAEQPAASSSSSEPSSAAADSSSPPETYRSAALDSLLKSVRSSKQPHVTRPSASPSPSSSSYSAGSAFAARGPAHASAFAQFASSPSFRTAPPPRASTPDELWAHAAPVPYSPPVTTTSARSFAVRGDGGVAKAYRNLNRVLFENNIRKELRRQERFEGPSDKRVRLNSERHRRRFKVAVGKAVSLAMRMKDL